MEWPEFGDVVEYEGRLWYFQSNGTFCLLYASYLDIGKVKLAQRSTERGAIRRPGAQQVAEFLKLDQPRPNPVYPSPYSSWH
jgi:hypothetical protein